MVMVLQREHFKIMPWKNGGGTTTELYRLEENDRLLFRLSVAQVDHSGPFSLFPGMQRLLFLLKGDGFRLKFFDHDFVLERPLAHLQFSGDEQVQCEVLGGPCLDFNVMVDEAFGDISHKIMPCHGQVVCDEKKWRKFIFSPHEFKLFCLEPKESIVLSSEGGEKIIEITLALK